MANGVATLCRDASATLASNCTFAASMHEGDVDGVPGG